MSSLSPLTSSSMAYRSGDVLVWGRSVTEVRSPMEEVLAYFWNSNARNQIKSDTIEKSYLEEPSRHSRVEYIIKKSPVSSIMRRDFCSTVIDKQMLFYSNTPTQHSSRPLNMNSVRALCTTFVQFTKSANMKDTKITYVIQIDSGGEGVPKLISEWALAYNLRRVTFAQQYFQQARYLKEYDEKDGAAIGEVLMLKSKAEKEGKQGTTKFQVSERTIFSIIPNRKSSRKQLNLVISMLFLKTFTW